MTGTKIQELGKTLGMNKEEINQILNNNTKTKEEFLLLLGPRPYGCGGYYGTISINHFRNFY
jgi:hypothetical protein